MQEVGRLTGGSGFERPSSMIRSISASEKSGAVVSACRRVCTSEGSDTTAWVLKLARNQSAFQPVCVMHKRKQKR